MAVKIIDREKYGDICENLPIYPGHNIPEIGSLKLGSKTRHCGTCIMHAKNTHIAMKLRG